MMTPVTAVLIQWFFVNFARLLKNVMTLLRSVREPVTPVSRHLLLTDVACRTVNLVISRAVELMHCEVLL